MLLAAHLLLEVCGLPVSLGSDAARRVAVDLLAPLQLLLVQQRCLAATGAHLLVVVALCVLALSLSNLRESG